MTGGSVRGGKRGRMASGRNSVASVRVMGQAGAKADDNAATTPAEDEDEGEDEGDLGASMTMDGVEQVDEDQERQKLR